MILWALTTIILSLACLNISFNLTVFITFESIISFKTFPAPTDGNWSLSPTKSTLVPNLTALSRLYINIISTIDASSNIITSASIGSSSSLKKTNSSLSLPNPISNNLWIVFASLLEVSLILFAALPVGAQSTTFWSLFSNIFIMVFIVVVFPVPGPPVIMVTSLFIASFTASIWFLAKLILSSFSTIFISSSIFICKSLISCCDNFIISLHTPFSQI